MCSSRARLALLLSATAALAACNTANSHIGDADPYMGEAVKYNAAIQTINPVPVYPATAAQPGDNGVHGAEAVKRYRTDKVKALENQDTTSGTSGGGSR